MKTVLFVIPSLHGGGAERVMLTLLQHFDRARIRPVLAVVDMRNAAYRDAVPADVELIDLGCTRVLAALPKIIRLLWARRPDLLFSTLGHLNLALSLVRSLFPCGVRHVARETMVVSEYLREFRRPRLWALLYRHAYRRVDRLVCQSFDMRDDLVGRFGFPPDKTRVIRNPLALAVIRARCAEPLPAEFAARVAGRLRLVAAGRLVAQKGFDLLVAALAQCPALDVQLDILGEGPERAALQTQIDAAGQGERICLRGFQANPYAWFAAADGFVLSSRYEGFSNVVLEALASGTPVVALPCPGGVREALTGVPGCEIAGEVSAEALADALRQWAVRGPARVPAEVVAPYAVEAIVGQYEELLLAAGGQ
ncbi:glycosyltransferase [Uliginosibacterium sp. 31-16]|uniref:glycosyltransferase n=1 Tax=Uliginosibacterium sp. 31-16 TaxID=3068315 RepID=UPI00273FAFDE|nr:glycosyltransferase [Uliginosibacterium sp. 31-16]MDP5238380.1 glycosyltransferase [Uliginosibacterium sp. 31-16]